MFIDIGDDARRQYIDAVATFRAWEDARAKAKAIRGGMLWRQQGGTDYLVRTSTRGAQTGLGPRSPKTEEMYASFVNRKAEATARLADLDQQLTRHQRMNRALQVGRAPQLLVDILVELDRHGLMPHFTVVGTHALYAYEAAAGVRFGTADVLATQDVDLLFDTRKRLQFETDMARVGTSMLGILQRVDRTFQIRSDQKYTAVNSKGFEVDIIRREQVEGDPHPLKLSAEEDDLWVAQARRAGVLLDAPRFEAVIVSPSGYMARMSTISPNVFVAFKRWLAEQRDRDTMKRRRDASQADVVAELIAEYLPQYEVG